MNLFTAQGTMAKFTDARQILDAFFDVKEAGSYTIRGSVNYEGKITEVQEVSFTVTATGVESVADSVLSAASPKQGRVDVSAMAQGERAVRIGNDVLKNASGIAQINQTAGAGNATANSFVLRPPAGTFF